MKQMVRIRELNDVFRDEDVFFSLNKYSFNKSIHQGSKEFKCKKKM